MSPLSTTEMTFLRLIMLMTQTSDVDQAMARKLHPYSNDSGLRPSGFKASVFDVGYRLN